MYTLSDSDIKKLRIHPLTEALPPMTEEEKASLRESLQAGYDPTQPIVLHEDKVLDGRHRLELCIESGIAPKFVKYREECGSPEAFVAARNLHRRHLTADQRAMALAKLFPAKPGRPKKVRQPGGLSAADIAAEAGVSPRKVERARRVAKDPEEAAAVEHGGKTLAAAERAVREKSLPPALETCSVSAGELAAPSAAEHVPEEAAVTDAAPVMGPSSKYDDKARTFTVQWTGVSVEESIRLLALVESLRSEAA